MPAQTSTRKVAYYEEFDTAPPLRQRLTDGAGNPLPLTAATVTIEIAFQRWNYYFSPTKNIVEAGPCVVEDQGTDPGWIHWIPGVNDLTPSGSFLYRFKIVYPDTSSQHVPPNTYLPMIITAPTGGSTGSKTAAP
jgi:hypothetical protein